jgi:hypothetical protein
VADEVFALGEHAAKLRVAAFPLHQSETIEGPPAVWVTFRPVGVQRSPAALRVAMTQLQRRAVIEI